MASPRAPDGPCQGALTGSPLPAAIPISGCSGPSTRRSRPPPRLHVIGRAQRTAHGSLRIVALRDSRRPGSAPASGQLRWPPARRVSRRRAHTHPEHRRTAPKVIIAWRGRAVVGGRRKARFAIRSAAVQQWPSARGVAPHSPATWHSSQTTFALWSLGRGAFRSCLPGQGTVRLRSPPRWQVGQIAQHSLSVGADSPPSTGTGRPAFTQMEQRRRRYAGLSCRRRASTLPGSGRLAG